jgi:predicted transcriptional regulator
MPPAKKADTKATSIRLKTKLLKRIKTLSTKLRRSQTSLHEEALEDLFEKHTGKKP